MSLVELKLFGDFSINVDSNDVTGILDKSSKSLDILQHLIINSSRFVSASELVELFWDDGKFADRTGALKTLISRLRKNLSVISSKFDKAISSSSKGYKFANKDNFLIDIFVYDSLCEKVLNTTKFTKEIRQVYMKILRLYKGQIKSRTKNSTWEHEVNQEREKVYNNVLIRLIENLKTLGEYDNILYIVKAATEIDPFNENMIMEQISILFKLNRRSEATRYYRELIKNYEKNNRLFPENVKNRYYEIVNSQMENCVQLETICDEISSIVLLSGATVCDYSMFKTIYQLQIKSLERWEVDLNIMLISISSREENPDPIFIDSCMRKLELILVKTLRKGDTISRYSFSQFVILLPAENFVKEAIENRITGRFSEIYPDDVKKIEFGFEVAVVKPKSSQ